MKVSQLLLPYLLQNKSFHLEGLGKFSIEKNATLSIEDNPNGSLPKGSVQFEANKKLGPDQDFIAYISKETGKIKPLASSDLESFTVIGKQLLYISKPFVIDGIGHLQLDTKHQLEFVQEEYSSGGNMETIRKGKSQEDVQFDDDYRQPVSKRKASGSNALLMALVVIGLGLMGYVAYFFYEKTEGKPEVHEQATQLILSSPPEDSVNQISADTSAKTETPVTPDSTVTPAPAPVTTQGFNIVLEVAKQKRALKRYADLKEWGHKVVMITKDSIDFKIAISVNKPLSDTTRVRDSLSNFFGKKVWVEIVSEGASR
ncbi:hypothetical protein [Pollutibacter soli]|uniref:hypothetical protein n=1 Tax=Pollutibacter soli TaxID=3034157 RepID=UPI0030134CCD